MIHRSMLRPAAALDAPDVERAWRAAGLDGRFAAVEVPGDGGRPDLGLVTASCTVGTVENVRRLDVDAALRPAVVQVGGLAVGPDGAPRRRAMGRALTTARPTTDGADPHRALADRIAARCPAPTVRVDLRAGDDPVHAPREGLVLVLHGAAHDRWDLVHALLGRGAAVVGTATLRDGAGVAWARHPSGISSSR